MILTTKYVLERIVNAKDKAHDDVLKEIKTSHAESLENLKEGFGQTIEVLKKENERLAHSLAKENARADAAIDRLLESRAKVDGIRHALIENAAAEASVEDKNSKITEKKVMKEFDRISNELNMIGEDDGAFSNEITEVAGEKIPVSSGG